MGNDKRPKRDEDSPQHAQTVKMTNIPIINLREEFEDHLKRFRDPNFREEIFNCGIRPVEFKDFLWRGLPNDLLTLLLLRAISGLESYLGAAVEYELHLRGKLSGDAKAALENPFSLHRIAIFALFEKLPALVDPSISLPTADRPLFERVRLFYKEVRNPIFHGSQVGISADNFSGIAEAFELMASVYDWIDAWYTAFLGGWRHQRDRTS